MAQGNKQEQVCINYNRYLYWLSNTIVLGTKLFVALPPMWRGFVVIVTLVQKKFSQWKVLSWISLAIAFLLLLYCDCHIWIFSDFCREQRLKFLKKEGRNFFFGYCIQKGSPKQGKLPQSLQKFHVFYYEIFDLWRGGRGSNICTPRGLPPPSSHFCPSFDCHIVKPYSFQRWKRKRIANHLLGKTCHNRNNKQNRLSTNQLSLLNVYTVDTEIQINVVLFWIRYTVEYFASVG